MKTRQFKTVFGFLQKEFSQVLRDTKMKIILFVLPLIQMTVFGVAISTEVKNIKLASIYGPNDYLARKIEESSLNSKWFISSGIHGEFRPENQDPVSLIKASAADVVLIAPAEGLQRTLQRGDGRLQLLIDGTNVIRAQSIERYIQSIVTETLRKDENSTLSTPVHFDVRILYNASLESAVFMVPGTMAMILCIVTILLTSMSIAKEKELGTLEMIIASPIKTWEVLLGKTIPFVLIGMINAASIFALAILVFKVPMRGSFFDLAVSAAAFIITTVSIGTLISTYSKNQQQAMMGGFIFLFVSNLLAGIMFPIENMPMLMKIVAYLNPMTYFVKLLRNIMLKGGSAEIVWSFTGILFLMSALTIFVSYKRFKHTLN